MLQLTTDNYFDFDANLQYMGSSQLKDFVPAWGGCEARAVAQYVKGTYEAPDKAVFKLGHYLHAWNEGPEHFATYIAENWDAIHTAKGTKRAEYQKMDDIIEAFMKSPLIMSALSGQKEVIFTAEMFGIDWKVMIDSYRPEMGWLVDVKGLKSLYDKEWNNEIGCYENVFEARGYLRQMAIYSEVERLANLRAEGFEPFLIVGTKEDPPDTEIISFVSTEQNLKYFVDNQLSNISQYIDRVKDVKHGGAKPRRCEKCAYCRGTKVLTGTTHYTAYSLYGGQ